MTLPPKQFCGVILSGKNFSSQKKRPLAGAPF
jgi:hypothetical protein